MIALCRMLSSTQDCRSAADLSSSLVLIHRHHRGSRCCRCLELRPRFPFTHHHSASSLASTYYVYPRLAAGVADETDPQFVTSWRDVYTNQPGLQNLAWYAIAGGCAPTRTRHACAWVCA